MDYDMELFFGMFSLVVTFYLFKCSLMLSKSPSGLLFIKFLTYCNSLDQLSVYLLQLTNCISRVNGAHI